MTLTYTAKLHNNWCAGEFLTSGKIGGVTLYRNFYHFPESVIQMMLDEMAQNETHSISIWVDVTATLTDEMLTPGSKLESLFLRQSVAVVPQRFKGSNQYDQRPAVTSNELFDKVLELLAPVWTEENFSLYQSGSNPIVKIDCHISDQLALQMIRLIGY